MSAATSTPAWARAALVTGATRSRGIAAAVARALAGDGWDVATTGWRPYDATEPWGSEPREAERLVDELRGLGVRAAFHEEDLGEPAAAVRIVAAAEAAVGPLSALVCVHTHSGLGGLLETTPADFDRHLAVNARGTMLLMAEFVRRFRGEVGTGRIVSFTSAPPLVGEVAYAASKGALEWLTLAVASELAGRGITVNAIDPGPTDTGWLDAPLHATIRAASPLGRLGRPEDAAALTAFLCSAAGGWVTGQILHSDGGFGTLRTLRRGRTAPTPG
jgi:3-oxoacyl-[acyl-carrier protein] reductase